MVRAVFFGSLSSLTDLVDLERRAFNAAFKEFGIPENWDDLGYASLLKQAGRFRGPTQVVDRVIPHGQDAFYKAVEMHFRTLLDTENLRLHPWTEAVLKETRGKPIRLALVSGAERQTVLRVLSALFRTSASHVFDCVTSFEDAERAKPGPDLYFKALSDLRMKRRDVVAVETTHDGLRSAQNASIAAAGFPTPYSSAEILDKADFALGTDLKTTIANFHASRLKRGPAHQLHAEQHHTALT